MTPSPDITELSERYFLDEQKIAGRFKIIKKIGGGGMGEIFLARDVKKRRRVAIKRIAIDSRQNPEARRLFIREARAASQLTHPNICAIHEVDEAGQSQYIVMAYIDGVTLDRLLERQPLPIAMAVAIGRQICAAMIQAHIQGIIHGDLKPGNIMIGRNGMVTILDFGLARISAHTLLPTDGQKDAEMVEKGFVLGTAAYMSPEQIRGLELDRRSDIFSFGSLMAEMLEGSNPFEDKDIAAILDHIVHREVRLTRPMPPFLQSIVLKMLRKDRHQRFSDFAQVLAGLDRLEMTGPAVKQELAKLVRQAKRPRPLARRRLQKIPRP